MKYIRYILVLLLLVCIVIPKSISADNYIVIDNDDIMIVRGSNEKITIALNNAAGRLDIDSTNTNIASIDKSKVFLDKSNEEITITGNNIGSTTINIYTTDVNTYDYQEISNLKYTINVTVYIKGDSDNSGQIDLEDITTLFKRYLCITTMTEKEKLISDMNSDSKVDIIDVIELLKVYLGIN